MSAVLDDKTGAQPPTIYDTHPERYVHWRLSFDGERATMSMDVNEEKGRMPGYKLKLNSYELGADIELYDALNRIRFQHPEVNRATITSSEEGIICCGAISVMI